MNVKNNALASHQSTQRTAEEIRSELNHIGCCLAGARDTLLELVDHNADAANVLYMLAEICSHANERICGYANDVSALNSGGAA
jgi:hypothetical protein